ncbi:DNA repair protein RadC [Salinimonas sp. HHU 13199]|uniref:DNA repair protein RadC n=1 Tax=Salinimonas profundi TaxID=2729140 RepID=A0ABR8LQH8_9ALTE|nr:DNA repair protein RadC [Salinimonas profundi]MBD3587638.1 DNA repair protein RadC [Salinimonas profundi]
MTIVTWPLCEQPREKLLRQGAEQLSDSELLAVFLGNGTQKQTVSMLSQAMMREFATVGRLLTADLHSFCAISGVGVVRFCQLQAAKELVKRMYEEPLTQKNVLSDVAQVSRYLRAQLMNAEHEIFAVLMLDSQHRLIAFRRMFSGTIDSAAVYPREILKQALKDNAAAIILVHNHPSGIADPSRADIALTKEIKAAMALVDISVLDHFIVGQGYVVSLSQQGLM